MNTALLLPLQRAGRRLGRPVRQFVATTGLALLAACGGNMATLPAGTSLAAIEKQYGKPDFQCTLPNGTERVIWTQQPMGQYAWGSDLDANGNPVKIELLLQDSQFAKLGSGRWTPDDVRCAFGPPAKIETVGLPSLTQTVWSYRYRESGAWNSLMYVYFGTDGTHVTRFHPGPDPLYTRDGWWFD